MDSAAPRTVPPGLLVSLVGWLLVAAILLDAALAGRRTSSGEGLIGSDAVAGTTGLPSSAVLVLAALATVLLGGLLVMGMGWALYPLVALTAAVLLISAGTGSWVTLMVMTGLVIGVAPLWMSRPYAYLHGR